MKGRKEANPFVSENDSKAHFLRALAFYFRN